MKSCLYCQHGIEPDFRDEENLKKFLTPRKKILSSVKSGVCAKHQRKLAAAVKHARYLAILPYSSYHKAGLD